MCPESLSAYICALRQHPWVGAPHGPIQPGQAPTPPSAKPAATTPADTPTQANASGLRRTIEPLGMADLISKRTSANTRGQPSDQPRVPVSTVGSHTWTYRRRWNSTSQHLCAALPHVVRYASGEAAPSTNTSRAAHILPPTPDAAQLQLAFPLTCTRGRQQTPRPDSLSSSR